MPLPVWGQRYSFFLLLANCVCMPLTSGEENSTAVFQRCSFQTLSHQSQHFTLFPVRHILTPLRLRSSHPFSVLPSFRGSWFSSKSWAECRDKTRIPPQGSDHHFSLECTQLPPMTIYFFLDSFSTVRQALATTSWHIKIDFPQEWLNWARM